MLDDAVDPRCWLDELPEGFVPWVTPPVRYEAHVDAQAHARKIIGLDTEGRRCYLRHTHTRTEDRFDADEWPIEVALTRERRFAWRLPDGRWLRVVERLERLDACQPRHRWFGPELIEASAADV